MQSKPKYAGLGIALGAALGAVFGVMAGNMGVWLAVGVAIGVAIGASWSRKAGVPALRSHSFIACSHPRQTRHELSRSRISQELELRAKS